jgi:Uma2 family endonuclease
MAAPKTDETSAVQSGEKFTYKDYKTWPEGERWELIEGQAFAMSPAPTRRHQELVVEILSPSTAMRDLGKKKILYEKHGVLEYWIVNPEDLSVLVYRRESGGFGRVVEYRRGERVESSSMAGFAWIAKP